MKKYLLFIFALVCLFFITACDKDITFSLEDNEITIKEGETYEIKPIIDLVGDDLFAFTYEDNGCITITDNVITALKAGETMVTVKLVKNPETFQKLKVIVVIDEEALPVINMEEGYEQNPTIIQGEAFDPRAGVKANSKVDGDLTSNITITGEVDTSKTGTQKLVYTVIDSKGNKTTLARTITVLEPDETEPVISMKSGFDQDATVDMLSAFNPLEGVQAIDGRDGDITASLAVSGTVDLNVPGTYRLVYTVSDKAGNSAEFVRVITVVEVDVTAPNLFVEEGIILNPFIALNSTFDVKAGVKAIDDFDGDITAKITVSGEVDTSNTGEYVLTYEVSDLKGNKATLVRTIKVVPALDTIAPTISLKEGAKEVLELNYGVEYDPKSDLVASDNNDGDLTDAIYVTKKHDTKRYNVQEVEVAVVDSYGNTTTFTRKVKVVWPHQTAFIGHAGSYYGIANTEEAFLNAAKTLHYQYIECDVKQTSDGVFVTCHDDTFAGKTISSMKYADLAKVVNTGSRTAGYPGPSNYNLIPNGTGQYSSTICTLERYLEICKEYGIVAVIELKSSSGITNSSQARMPALMDVIKKVDMLDQVVFLGSQYNCLIWVKQNGYDYIPCQYLVNSFESVDVYNRCIQYGLDVSINVTSTYSNNDTWLKKYQDADIKVSTWTFTQYVDYDVVQSWIDKGVDFVTCDWQEIEKFNLPLRVEGSQKFTVKFYDKDDNLLKETLVKEGRTAQAPSAPVVNGYNFVGWSGSIENVTADISVKAQYELATYNITYNENLYKLVSTTWENKEAFVSEFYNDLDDWMGTQVGKMNGLTKSGNKYTLVNNSSTNGTASWSNVEELRALDLYVFEASISCHLYKPLTVANYADYIPEEDNNYFLNTEPYRTKYQGMNEYLLNAINGQYTSYSTQFKPASNDRVQIFFRFHQWCKGTNISVFNNYPVKYEKQSYANVSVTLPTEHLTYTIEDDFVLPVPTVSGATFGGWYTKQDLSGDPVTKINKGQFGDINLYAKWILPN